MRQCKAIEHGGGGCQNLTAHTHMRLVRSQLRVELSEIHSVLRLASGSIDTLQEIVKELEDFWDLNEIGVVLTRTLEDGLEEKRVSTKSRRRSGEESVELDLTRLWQSLDLVNELDKLGVVDLFLFKLVLAVLLMTTIVDEGLEERDSLEEDVSNLLDDGLRALSLVKHVREYGVVPKDGRNVPEDLGNKRIASIGRLNDIFGPKRLDPELPWAKKNREEVERTGRVSFKTTYSHRGVQHSQRYITHISQVLEIPDKVPLGEDEFVDGLLSFPLLWLDRFQNLLRDRRGPERRTGRLVVFETLCADGFFEPRLRLKVEPLSLLKSTGTSDRVTERSVAACGRVAIKQKSEDAGRNALFSVQRKGDAAG